jgi:hypothetical protein
VFVVIAATAVEPVMVDLTAVLMVIIVRVVPLAVLGTARTQVGVRAVARGIAVVQALPVKEVLALMVAAERVMEQ